MSAFKIRTSCPLDNQKPKTGDMTIMDTELTPEAQSALDSAYAFLIQRRRLRLASKVGQVVQMSAEASEEQIITVPDEAEDGDAT